MPTRKGVDTDAVVNVFYLDVLMIVFILTLKGLKQQGIGCW